MTTGTYLAFTGGTRRSSKQHPGFIVFEGGKGKPVATPQTAPALALTGARASDAIASALAPPVRAQTTHGYDAAPYHTAAIEAAAGSRGPQPKPWINNVPPTRAQTQVTHGYDAAPYHTAAIEEAAGSRRPQPKPWIMDLPSTHPEW